MNPELERKAEGLHTFQMQIERNRSMLSLDLNLIDVEACNECVLVFHFIFAFSYNTTRRRALFQKFLFVVEIHVMQNVYFSYKILHTNVRISVTNSHEITFLFHGELIVILVQDF